MASSSSSHALAPLPAVQPAMTAQQHGSVGLALGLAAAAGAATALGAALVFAPRAASRPALSAALAASAGVMLYVALVDIYAGKSLSAFEGAGLSQAQGNRCATGAFFAGAAFTAALDWAIGRGSKALQLALRRWRERRQRRGSSGDDCVEDRAAAAVATATDGEEEEDDAAVLVVDGGDSAPADDFGHAEGSHQHHHRLHHRHAAQHPPCKHGIDPEACYDDSEARPRQGRCGGCCGGEGSSSSDGGGVGGGGKSTAPINANDANRSGKKGACVDSSDGDDDVDEDDEHAALGRAGLLSALAIGLHNLPEGLATFIATLASPLSGGSVAMAIALHNIPEGVAIALPIYHATGSRLRAFVTGALIGLAEPAGALLGLATLAAAGRSGGGRGGGSGGSAAALVGPMTFGVTFAFVSGIMCFLSIGSLLPQAYKHARRAVVTGAFFGGAAVMAGSLLLFEAGS